MSNPGSILAVIGAQFGSEGKGNLVAHIADEYNVHVRVGGPNAGHSFKHEGRTWKMQSIPCGWKNEAATLIIGRGALVSVEQLYSEWRMLKDAGHDVSGRLKIDRMAGIISPWHHAEAGGVHGEAHQRYGSTGEGVGVARIARIQRYAAEAFPEGKQGFFHAGTVPTSILPDDEEFRDAWHDMLDWDTVEIMLAYRNGGENVLLEGTQGSALSLIHGPWPYTSNHDTNAAQIAADCGLAPRLVDRCLLVMRTLPIRVAGNSGPMNHELSWDTVSERVGKPVTEQTTVTKKTRRVGEWDEALVEKALQLNQPTSVAVNFIDYLCPQDEGKTEASELSERSWAFIEYVSRMSGVPVAMVGTGGLNWSVCDIESPRAEL